MVLRFTRDGRSVETRLSGIRTGSPQDLVLLPGDRIELILRPRTFSVFGATTRVADLETAWDDAQAHLKPRDPAAWTRIDGRIDTVLRELRSTHPQPDSEKQALTALLDSLA